jgi:SPP1 family predicted phage head-tail adaptor
MTTFLTTAELAKIRGDIEGGLLPDTCHLLTLTRTSDGQGGWSEAWGTASASVACRLDGLRGSDQISADSLQAFHSWVLTLPYNTTITAAYRVEHGGNTYTVTSVDTDKSWKASVRAYVELV